MTMPSFNPRTPCGVRPHTSGSGNIWGGFQSTHSLRSATELILDIDEDTIEQLVAPRLQTDAIGRVRIESKEDMAKRGVRSPDRADALVMAWHARRNSGLAWTLGAWYARPVSSKRAYGRY